MLQHIQHPQGSSSENQSLFPRLPFQPYWQNIPPTTPAAAAAPTPHHIPAMMLPQTREEFTLCLRLNADRFPPGLCVQTLTHSEPRKGTMPAPGKSHYLCEKINKNEHSIPIKT